MKYSLKYWFILLILPLVVTIAPLNIKAETRENLPESFVSLHAPA